MRLILLTFALVFFIIAGFASATSTSDSWRIRFLAFGLACATASQYPFPF